jgi:curved DNA-binding protein
MDYIDYYKMLELSPSATADEIKKAYRRLARKYHPDLNPTDESAKRRFQEINEANEVLSDPEKRAKYDKYGKDWKQADAYEQASGTYGGAQGRAFNGAGTDFYETFSGGGFSDFFESLFGNGRGHRTYSRAGFKGQDYHGKLQLTLKEASQTHKRTIEVGGKKIRITVQAGLEDGQTIKIKGYGAASEGGGEPGDLYLTFQVFPDPFFKREGNHLYKTEKIPLVTAVLGGEITIETFDGKVRASIPPGSQPGSKVKLKGKGFPVYKKDGEFGDLYLTLQVEIPRQLSERQRRLFEELAESEKKRG